jgi:hypothetical protein
MPDENIVITDTPNGTGDDQPNTTLTAEERLQKLEETNKKLFARAKTAEGFVQDSSGNWVKKEKPQATISETAARPSDILKSDEFRLHRMGYDEQEIDLIMHNGGAKVLENKSSPLVLGLERAREQRKAEIAAGGTSDKSGLSEVERKYTPEQMRNMKPDELANLIGFANSN